jgi:hypothetical protein
MDKNSDQKLTYAEFVNGSKQDSAIAKVSPFPSRRMFTPSLDSVILGSDLVWWFCVIYSGAASRSVPPMKRALDRVDDRSPLYVQTLIPTVGPV